MHNFSPFPTDVIDEWNGWIISSCISESLLTENGYFILVIRVMSMVSSKSIVLGHAGNLPIMIDIPFYLHPLDFKGI